MGCASALPPASVTIVTTCKGRLGHLKQSLPTMVATGLPVVLVDYDCPEGAQHYAEENFPDVNIVAVAGRTVFNLAAARNLGAAVARSPFVFFCDCDVLVGEAFSAALRGLALSEQAFLVGGTGTLHGQCIVAKAAFDRIGGYDEVITGWGGEDGDFYLRLQAAGCGRGELPADLLTALPHSNRERTAFTGGGDPKASHRLNVAYATIKRDLEVLGTKPLPRELCEKVRAVVVAAFDQAERTHRAAVVTFPIPVALGPVAHLLDGTEGYRLTRHLRYEIAPVSPSRWSRLVMTLRAGRILARLKRRLFNRQAAPR